MHDHDAHGWFKWCNAAYWLSLSLWMAAILSAGVAAMGVFSVLPKAGVHVERFSALGTDAALHGRILGGQVMEPIFTATDLVQVACAIVTVTTLILQMIIFSMRWRRPANLIRIVCILAAAALMAVHLIMFAPRMNRELRNSWREAEAGHVERWQQHRNAFEADHIVANRLFNVRFLLLIAAIAASAAALTPPSGANSAKPHALGN